jgi:hypothetical protein
VRRIQLQLKRVIIYCRINSSSEHALPRGLDEDGMPRYLLYDSTYENLRQNGKLIEFKINEREIRGIILPRKAFAEFTYGSLIKYVQNFFSAHFNHSRHSFHGSWKGAKGKIKIMQPIIDQ